MKIVLFLLLITVASKAVSEEQKALHLFVEKLLQDQCQLDPDFDYWQGASMKQPSGGYLYRFYSDITGDGIDELFLSSSLDSYRNLAEWDIFKKNLYGVYQAISSNFYLGVKGYYIHTNLSEPFLKIISGRAQEEVVISTYKIDSNGIFSVERRQLKQEELGLLEKEGWETQFEMGKFVKPDIEKVLLGQYCRNPKILWQKYNREHSVDQQYLDPADAEDIKSIEDFTPEEAQRFVEQWKQKETRTNSSPKTSFIPFNQTQTNLSSQTTLEKKSSKQIIIWSIIVILGLGLVTIFILKKTNLNL